jgi:hypothetical protein
MKHSRFLRWASTAGACLLYIGRSAADPVGGDQITPIGKALCEDMIAHHVLSPSAPLGCERLRLLKFAYVGFDQQLHEDGEIVVMDAVAEHALRIFVELREKRFPIAKAKLMNAYGGNDNASMADNNTSAFNYRRITGGSLISLHGYGLAIDVNPVQNPYLKGSGPIVRISPEAGAGYVNRLNNRPGKMRREGMAEDVIDIFANNGFLIWGGYWENPIDYQHFDVGRALADKLVHSPPALAHELFTRHVNRYLECRHAKQSEAERSACISAESLDSDSSVE